MTAHPLDRPAAHALATYQAAHAIGDDKARRFDPDYALFADWDDEAALAALVAPGEAIAAVEAFPLPVPAGFSARRADCLQMIATDIVGDDADVVPLIDDDTPSMLGLTGLTEPGPFFAKTSQLGRFVGIRNGGELVAMAGERMHFPGYREVSAVCTHPAHRGRGYAAALTRFVARRIIADGETPFLQAYADNVAAIALYTWLGFRVRRPVTFSLLRRT